MNLIQNLDFNTYVLVGLGTTLFCYSMYCFITKTIPLGYKTINFSSAKDNINADTANQVINTVGDESWKPAVITEEELLQDFLQGRPIGGNNLEEPTVPNDNEEELLQDEEELLQNLDFLQENNIDDFIIDETPVPTFVEILYNIFNNLLF
jgi:hypothetical protein